MIGELDGISCDVRSNSDIAEKNFRHPRIELKNEKKSTNSTEKVLATN